MFELNTKKMKGKPIETYIHSGRNDGQVNIVADYGNQGMFEIYLEEWDVELKYYNIYPGFVDPYLREEKEWRRDRDFIAQLWDENKDKAEEIEA